MTTTTPATELHSRHRTGCHKPPMQTSAAPGGTRYTCPNCGKYYTIAGQAEPRKVTSSGYVCREHPDQPVTWRGTGCRQCAADRRKPKRKAPEPSDPTTKENQP